jgi:hypothetical protein
MDTVYFIDVLGHDDMADICLPEIIRTNWPALLAPIPEMKGGETPTKEEIDSALRNGLQPLFPLSDGVVYAPMGGGVTSARGSSARAVSLTHRLLRRARDREKQCRGSADRIARAFGLTELRLRYDVHRDTVIELQTGSLVIL